MQYIVYDLEATCWEKGTRPKRMEIIEIGAVRVDATKLTIRDEFDTFVQPVSEPELSDFCRNLTSIRQEDIDSAQTFPDALKDFLGWIGTDETILCSWGGYDRNQIIVDCRRRSIEPQIVLENCKGYTECVVE